MAPKIAIVYYSMYGHIKQMVCTDFGWWGCCGSIRPGGMVNIKSLTNTRPMLS
jgi:hypothetical protein